ncbi:hypothetical protein [Pantoea sp. CFSAN033090]|uniref:hypothetical protein n=1 Tax=Pantoea sp. CFSAN033090 TaxID=1690502 RepID=UPI00068BFC89|nr:hypothetical protein [Pantoea sp. CFSAN033090]KOA70456.1 hypothetical protein AFL22_11110 [Pantoea sp. CFSAN033090]
MGEQFDSEPYLLEIRKLAASCQQGEPFMSVKVKVETIVVSYKKKIGSEAEVQVAKWTELFNRLGDYLNNNAAPEWVSVIRYARKIINYKKHNAIFRMRQLSEPESSPPTRDNG